MRAMKVPFEIDPTGRVGGVSGEYPVLAAYLHALIMTRWGERVMRPTYGSRVPEAVFEPMGELLEAELDADIRDTVRNWEPDVDVIAINFETIDDTKLRVELVFAVRSNLAETTSSVSVTIDAGGTVEETS